MTRQEIWNCVLVRLGFAESDDIPSPRLMYNAQVNLQSQQRRIENQVAELLTTANSLTARNESVDATYIRTVTLALSEAQDRRDALINDRYNRLEASLAAFELEARNAIEGNLHAIEAVNERMQATIRKLRAGLE